MSPMNKRYTGLLFVFMSVFVAMSLGGLYYYFQIKKNETYQNQLHFRELNDISKSLNSAYDQMLLVAQEGGKYFLNTYEITEASLTAYREAVSSRDAEQTKIKENFEKLRKEENVNAAQALKSYDSAKEKRINAAKAMDENSYEILDVEDSAEVFIEETLEELDSEQIDFIDDYCGDYEEKCSWLGELVENVFNIELYESQGFNVTEHINSSYSKAEQGRKDSSTQLKQYKDSIISLRSILKKPNPLASINDDNIGKLCSSLKSILELDACDEIIASAISFQNNLAAIDEINTKLTDQNIDPKTKSALNTNKATLTNEQSKLTEDSNKIIKTFNEYITEMEQALNRLNKAFNHVFDVLNDDDFKTEFSSLMKQYNELTAKNSSLDNDLSVAIENEELKKSAYEKLLVNTKEDSLVQQLKNSDSAFHKRLRIELNQLQKSIENQLQTSGKRQSKKGRIKSKEKSKTVKQKVEDAINSLHTCLRNNFSNQNNQASIIDGQNHCANEADNLRSLQSAHISSITETSSGTFLSNATTRFTASPSSLENESSPSDNVDNNQLPIESETEINVTSQAIVLTHETDQVTQSHEDKKYQPKDFHFKLHDKENVISLHYKIAQGIIDISAPSTDFFSNNLRHPLVLLVDEYGNKLAQKHNDNLGVFQRGITFDDTQQILTKLAHQQASNHNENSDNDKEAQSKNNVSHSRSLTNNDSAPGYSDYIEMTISGIDYRVFITPINLIKERYKNEVSYNTYYLLGFMPKSVLSTNKLTISNSLVLIVLLLLIGSVAFIPLLKVRLVSINQAFSSVDRRAAFIGIGIVAGLLTISIFDNVYYSQLKANIQEQSEHIHKQMQDQFEQEMRALIAKAQKYGNDAALLDRTTKNKDELITEYVDSKGNHVRSQQTLLTTQHYFLENLFYLYDDGKLEDTALWSSAKFFRYDSIDLNDRSYFKKPIKCQVWNTPLLSSSGKTSCKNGLLAERINNVRDGRKTTQIAIPQFTALDSALSLKTLNFGTKLQTFFAPLLPKDFGFLVFENESGDVLYHSDYERELVEDIYIETDNNQKLLRVVATSELNNETKSFNANYRGSDYSFVAGRLVKNIPWTLVIFYEKKSLRTMNMLTAMTSISLFLITIFFTYALLMLVAALRFRSQLTLSAPVLFMRKIFWFNERLKESYINTTKHLIIISLITSVFVWAITPFIIKVNIWLVIAIVSLLLLMLAFKIYKSNEEENKETDISTTNSATTEVASRLDYNMYLLAFFLCFFMTPAFIYSVISSGYFLDKKVTLDAIYLQESFKNNVDRRAEYFALVNDNLSINDTASWPLPCYLGDGLKGGKNYHCQKQFISNYENKSMLATHTNNNANALDGLWSYLNLNLSFAKSMWFLSQNDEDQCISNDVSKGQITTLQCNNHLKFIGKFRSLFLHAIFNNIWMLVLLVPLAFIGLYFFINEWLSKRLVGTDIPQNFRINDSKGQGKTNKLDRLFDYLKIDKANKNHRGKYVQIIRPSKGFITDLFGDVEDLSLVEKYREINLLQKEPLAIEALLDTNWRIEQVLATELNITKDSPAQTIVLKRLELLSLSSERRFRALEVIEHLMTLKQINIVILADIAPLYRLINQTAYPNKLSKTDIATPAEVLRWSRLMRNFKKVYDWTPNSRYTPINPTSYKMVEYESTAWPETSNFKQEFIAYHRTVKDAELSDNCPNEELIRSVNTHWKPEQVIEFFGANTGAFYRYRWELCTKAERLLLIQIAGGYSPNPRNLEPLEHLVRRGYIYQSNGWYIVNKSFERFVVSAEEPHIVSAWIEEANESTWKYFRIPIFTVIIVTCGVLAYTASEAIESLMAVFTGLLGLLPLVLRNLSLFKGGNSSPNE